MRKSTTKAVFTLWAIFALFGMSTSCLALGEPMRLVQTIPLPDLHEGDFDHFAVDLPGHRLFLTVEQGVVEIFDLRSNKLLHSITGLDEPHSLVYRADLKKLFIVDGGAAELKVYDSDTYQLLSSVKLEVDCDSMAFDPATKRMYIVDGGRAAHTPYSFISVVDTTAAKKLADIKIDTNRVEALVLERSGPRLFASLTGLNAVGVFDRNTDKLLTTWPVEAEGQLNVPLAFDQPHHRLFTVTGKPAKLIVLDSDSGKIVASVPTIEMVDDVSYHLQKARIYASGNEFVDVFQQTDPDHYSQIGHVAGAFRAKTSFLLPELNRFYLAVPRHGDKAAELRVYKILP
jgi:DNA-binding beta-propeller fold protein YncE